MDDIFYDTSLTLYTISDSSLPFRNLLQAHTGALQSRAIKLREHLSRRPKYEDDEEKEKIGGLRDCTWTALQNPTQTVRRKDADGIAIILTYDKAVYKFMLYSTATTTRPGTKVEIPLLLAKASAAITRLFLSFLAEQFHVSITPMKLPPTFLSTTTSIYISSLHASFTQTSETTSILSLLTSTIGTLKLSVTVNPGSATGADIAQHLRVMDIDIPPETLYQLLSSQSRSSSSTTTNGGVVRHPTFLHALQHHIRERTGLVLPLLPKDQPSSDNADEPALRLSRVSSMAFALSTEGRLKFSRRALEAAELVLGMDGQENNVVKKANTRMLEAIVAEAMKNG